MSFDIKVRYVDGSLSVLPCTAPLTLAGLKDRVFSDRRFPIEDQIFYANGKELTAAEVISSDATLSMVLLTIGKLGDGHVACGGFASYCSCEPCDKRYNFLIAAPMEARAAFLENAGFPAEDVARELLKSRGTVERAASALAGGGKAAAPQRRRV